MYRQNEQLTLFKNNHSSSTTVGLVVTRAEALSYSRRAGGAHVRNDRTTVAPHAATRAFGKSRREPRSLQRHLCHFVSSLLASAVSAHSALPA